MLFRRDSVFKGVKKPHIIYLFQQPVRGTADRAVCHKVTVSALCVAGVNEVQTVRRDGCAVYF
jgi:hypothetical protein